MIKITNDDFELVKRCLTKIYPNVKIQIVHNEEAVIQIDNCIELLPFVTKECRRTIAGYREFEVTKWKVNYSGYIAGIEETEDFCETELGIYNNIGDAIVGIVAWQTNSMICDMQTAISLNKEVAV